MPNSTHTPTFTTLSIDMIGLLITYFPADIASQLRVLNQNWNYLVPMFNWYWKMKCTLHFPFSRADIEKKIPPYSASPQRSDACAWYHVFQQLAAEEYQKFTYHKKHRVSVKVKKAFIYVKETDVERLAQIEWHEEEDPLCILDKHKCDLLEWALASEDQSLLDHLYYLAYNSSERHKNVTLYFEDMEIPWLLVMAVACHQSLPVIKKVLSHVHEVCSLQGHRLLHIAAFLENLDLVEAILQEAREKCSHDPLKPLYLHDNTVNETPLIVSARMGKVDTVKCILNQRGLSLTQAKAVEASYSAIWRGHQNIAQMLITALIKADLWNGEYEKKILFHATVAVDALEVLAGIIDRDPPTLYVQYPNQPIYLHTRWSPLGPPMTKTKITVTPLILAVKWGRTPTVKLLLNKLKTYNQDLVRAGAEMALYIALDHHHLDIASYLIQAGATQNLKDPIAFNILLKIAVIVENNDIIIELLKTLQNPILWSASSHPKKHNFDSLPPISTTLSEMLLGIQLHPLVQDLLGLYDYLWKLFSQSRAENNYSFAYQTKRETLTAGYYLLHCALFGPSIAGHKDIQELLQEYPVLVTDPELKSFTEKLLGPVEPSPTSEICTSFSPACQMTVAP